jgi:hypothetical protein
VGRGQPGAGVAAPQRRALRGACLGDVLAVAGTVDVDAYGVHRRSHVDAIGAHLGGISVERVRQIEAVALRKVGIALTLRERLGAQRAHALWDKLRGKSLGHFERALRAVS